MKKLNCDHSNSCFCDSIQLFRMTGSPKNCHFGNGYDRGYESGFTTKCSLNNYSIVRSAIYLGLTHASSMPRMLDLLSVATETADEFIYK